VLGIFSLSLHANDTQNMIAIGIKLKVGRRNAKLDLTYRNDHPNLALTICFDRYANTAATRKVNIFALFPSIPRAYKQ
jgi:hypothetical protein